MTRKEYAIIHAKTMTRIFAMKRLILTVALGGMLSASAVDYSSSAVSGDMATPDNWVGGTLPSSGDEANVDGTVVALNSFSLSSNLSVGALSFLNWTRSASINFGGNTLSASSAQFGGAGPVTLANGTLQTSGKVATLASSTVIVGSGATVQMPATVAKNEELKLSKAGAKMVVDGGTFFAPAATAGDCGNQIGDWSSVAAALEVINGGRFEIQAGRSQLTLMNASRLLVDHSTFKQNVGMVDYPFIVGYSGGVIAVTNSTFQFHKLSLGGTSGLNLGAKNALISFHDSIVTSSFVNASDNYGLETFGTAQNNRIALSGPNTKASFSIKFGTGNGNIVTMTNVTHMGRIAMTGGSSNSVEMVGGSGWGRLELKGGVCNSFSMKNSSRPTVVETFIGGTSNSVDVSGGTFAQKDKDSALNFQSGRDSLFSVRDGAVAVVGQYGDRSAISFAGATNALIRIDNATLTTMGYLDWSAVPGNSPGVCMEFAGAAPQLVCSFWNTVRQNEMTLGAANAADKDSVPRIRFRLPKAPYAKPVITTSDSWFRVVVNPTAVMEFDFSECGEARGKRRYPLIDRIPTLTDETLAALNTTASLPDGCKLVATKNVTSNNANGTWLLSLVKRGNGGFVVSVR